MKKEELSDPEIGEVENPLIWVHGETIWEIEFLGNSLTQRNKTKVHQIVPFMLLDKNSTI